MVANQAVRSIPTARVQLSLWQFLDLVVQSTGSLAVSLFWSLSKRREKLRHEFLEPDHIFVHPLWEIYIVVLFFEFIRNKSARRTLVSVFQRFSQNGRKMWTRRQLSVQKVSKYEEMLGIRELLFFRKFLFDSELPRRPQGVGQQQKSTIRYIFHPSRFRYIFQLYKWKICINFSLTDSLWN